MTKTSGENREEQFKTLMIIGAPEVQRSSMTIINPPKSTTVSPVVHASVFSIVPAAAPTTLSPGLTDNTPAAPGLENVVSPKNVVTGPNSPRMDTVPVPGLAPPTNDTLVLAAGPVQAIEVTADPATIVAPAPAVPAIASDQPNYDAMWPNADQVAAMYPA